MGGSAFLLELGVIVLGLAVLARLANRFGFSPIPLYLLAGLAFGHGGLAPVVTAEGFVEAGAEIGVILLLLMLGVEYSADELAESLRRSARPGGVDLVANAAPGVLLALVLGWGWTGALLLGGITYVTSSSVLSRVVDDLGWVGNREMPVVLSLAVVEDLAMALYLPAMAVVLGGTGAVRGTITLLLALFAVVAILLLALRFGPSLSRAVFSPSDEAVLLAVLGMGLLVAGAAEALNVSAAVAAFLLGIAISGPVASHARRLLAPLRDLFAGVFFVFFGLQVDPSSLPPVLVAAFGLAVVTGATKLFTGMWAAGRAGLGRRARVRAGALLIPRGEFSIAIASLGVSSGAPADIGPLTAAYVLLLAIAAPLLARVLHTRALAASGRTEAVGGRAGPPGG
jgi:monovalent cation:H+ antiporter-2, CPA2 family